MRLMLGACALLLALGASDARGLTPLSPPEDQVRTSSDGRCLIHAQVAENRIVGFRVENNVKTQLWTIPTYHRVFAHADDCSSLIATWDGGSAIGFGAIGSKTIVMTLYNSGKLLRWVTIGELYPELQILKHEQEWWFERLAWEQNSWVIRTVDGREFRFDAETGRKAN